MRRWFDSINIRKGVWDNGSPPPVFAHLKKNIIRKIKTINKMEAFEFARENNGVIFGYVTQGDRIQNQTEEQLN